MGTAAHDTVTDEPSGEKVPHVEPVKLDIANSHVPVLFHVAPVGANVIGARSPVPLQPPRTLLRSMLGRE